MELIGKKIKHVRAMTKKEMDVEGWDRTPLVIEFTDGSKIYASQDDEGNGPGSMFGVDKDGTQIYLGI